MSGSMPSERSQVDSPRCTISSAWSASSASTSSPADPPRASTTRGTRAAGAVTQYSYSSAPSQPLRSCPSNTRSPDSVSTASTNSRLRDQRRREGTDHTVPIGGFEARALAAPAPQPTIDGSGGGQHVVHRHGDQVVVAGTVHDL